MNDSVQSDVERPSGIGAFFRGAFSGAMSGGLMMGILWSLSFIPLFAAAAPGLASAGLMIRATSLFGGAMATKHALFDGHSSQHSHRTTRETIIPVPVQGMSVPTIAPSVDAAPDAPSAPTKNWVATAGRDGDSQGRIQEILNRNTMTDKARAEAILAAREAARDPEAVRG